MNRRSLVSLARSIKGRRCIGSLECVVDTDEDAIRDVAEKYGLLYHIEPLEGGDEVIFCKPNSKHVLDRFLKYLRGGSETTKETHAGLTPKEHYELGLEFGIPEEEARWFEEEMEEEVGSV